uniref:4-nitrophenylphosphatase n=1 Tax=Palpitomonas bilix TaxID=652834 RepID=A0A7S3DL17_9EUKA|mmetsp:Transcript_42403/g.109092  ORF Transcript_42403/g.109092 Transcript_42403/m.109092 type:complete len:256 (+) Transcript_42403:398-1165(+)
MYGGQLDGFDGCVHWCRMGFEGVAEEDIISSAYVASEYLAAQLPAGSGVFVCGASGIYRELEKVGLKPCKPFEEEYKGKAWDLHEVESIPLDNNVKAVLCGLDIHMSYPKIATASRYIKNNRAMFVATNADSTLPVKTGFLPGAGSCVSSISRVTGQEPIVTGKPSVDPLASILNVAAQLYDRKRSSNVAPFHPSRALMVGDRVDTDMMFGRQAGMRTLLVLSGVATEEHVQEHTSEIDYVTSDLGEFVHYISDV